MSKPKVLFVCVHNSARSQMAEAFLNSLAGERFEAFSAGLEKGELNPVVVDAMFEAGIDISGKTAKTVFDPAICTQAYAYVITVCDESSAKACPTFPGGGTRLQWSFADPSALRGDYKEKIKETRVIRDRIKAKVEEFLRVQTPA